MRFIGSSSSNINGTDGMVFGNGKEVKIRLEQQRQKAPQHPNNSVTPIITSGGCNDDQPGMLDKGFQSQEMVPGHHTNFPVPGEQDFRASEVKENILAPYDFSTPDDYKSKQESSSSTAAENCVAQESDYGSRISSTALMIDYRLIATEKSTASTDELSETDPHVLDTKIYDSSNKGQSFSMEYSKMEGTLVPAQQDLWIQIDGQGVSTSQYNRVQDNTDKTARSSACFQAIKAAPKQKPTRRMSHEKVHKKNFRRAMEAAVEFRKTRRQKRGNKRRGPMKMNNKVAELTAEEQAMGEFPGIPVQKAMEAFARKEEARAARALEPNFIYDEQRLVMEDFEAEHRQQLELVDQLEHEEEVAGWIIGDNVEDGFGVGIDDGMDVGVFDRDFWMVNGLEDQDDLAWMEGDDAFAQSSLALTPPHH
ncbi:hypothetical protein CAEBREN_12310 [Caenorhabditis brenneri]|uniref:Uncharacterized protein n=1 Tax=Caenorhabditis brenneri TaxID=135651 RepID=G0MD09_CAEBE|nr:hypothetical protein CAEBREN_12310 [Caenorhabditis brenneri]